MTYQNIMIDRIKALIDDIHCNDCRLENNCYNYKLCLEAIEWLNEQYI